MHDASGKNCFHVRTAAQRITRMSAFMPDYLGNKVRCTCGRTHTVSTKMVLIGADVLARLPEVLDRLGISGKVLMVYDHNTWRVAGRALAPVLDADSKRRYVPFVFPGTQALKCDEAALAMLTKNIGTHAAILAVGSGTINDLCKVAAFNKKKPYVSIATAASMDGYLSANAAVLVKGVKIAFNGLNPPTAVLADTTVLRTAPAIMMQAGLGDALGKCVSGAEWYLNHRLNDEYRCPVIWRMVDREYQRLLLAAKTGRPTSDAFLTALVRTLLVTGIAMQMAGNSAPASGGEHFISHALEMRGFALKGHAPSMHGLQVAFGTRVMIDLYLKMLAGPKPSFGLSSISGLYRQHTADWQYIGINLQDMIDAKIQMHSRCADRFGSIFTQRERRRLRAFFKQAPLVRFLYKKYKLPATPAALGIAAADARFAVAHAVDIRKRFTLIDLYYAAARQTTCGGIPS
jgi:glycerol-1-phosphate dehydrogenase [NAD(P)+]